MYERYILPNPNPLLLSQRPYNVQCTTSPPISEVLFIYEIVYMKVNIAVPIIL